METFEARTRIGAWWHLHKAHRMGAHGFTAGNGHLIFCCRQTRREFVESIQRVTTADHEPSGLYL